MVFHWDLTGRVKFLLGTVYLLSVKSYCTKMKDVNLDRNHTSSKDAFFIKNEKLLKKTMNVKFTLHLFTLFSMCFNKTFVHNNPTHFIESI